MNVTDDNKAEVVAHLLAATRFSLDTETTGLEWADTPFALVMATSERVFYTEDFSILELLFPHKLEVVMANAKFDMRMIKLPFYSNWIIRDVCIFERILSNSGISLASYSLEAVSKKRLGKSKSTEVDAYIKMYHCYEERTTKYTDETYKAKRFDRVDREILQRYAELDATLTLECYEAQLLASDSDDRSVFQVESDLLHATYQMEMQGIRLDVPYTEKAIMHEHTLLEEARAKFQAFAGIPYANKKSVLIPLFLAGGDTIATTAKGNPRLTDDDLEGFTSPAGRLVQQIRYHEKRISTYFTSYLDLVDDDGYIHPNIIQHGTKTGRFSYAAPNLQNIPKDEPDSNPYTIRGCFAPDPGNVFLSLDYSQQEYRVMLDYANEKKVIAEVMAGKDLHQSIADMAHVSRKQAKTLNFACISKGQLVLTNFGQVPIEDLTKHHLVWDGVEWVSHGGVVFNGIKEVFSYSGITATADHIVFTEEGAQVSFAEAIKGQLTLAKAGDGGNEIRVFGDNERATSAVPSPLHLLSKMRQMWEIYGCVPSKYLLRENYKLQVLAWAEAWLCLKDYKRSCERYAVQEVHGNGPEMQKQKMQGVSRLWRQRNISENWCRRVHGFCKRELHRRAVSGVHDRQNKQRWGLLTREYKICSHGRELKEQAHYCTVRLQRRADLLRGSMEKFTQGLSNFFSIKRTYQDAGTGGGWSRGHLISEGQREVYDVLNCGPRNRFTVGGILVHNCLYGSGPANIGEMLGITLAEATRLRTNYLLALPKVDQFISNVISANKKRGFVKTWAGRKLRNEFGNSYKAPNHLIQGGCGDVIKKAMILIHGLLKGTGVKMRLQVHDQLVFEGTREELMQLCEKIRIIMHGVYPSKNGVVLTTDASYSETSFAERTMKKWT